MASTSEELSSQAEMLQQAIGFFRISDNGNGSKQAAHERASIVKTVRAVPTIKDRASVAHINTWEEDATETGHGNGKHGGVAVFHAGENENVGDERDAEFEHY